MIFMEERSTVCFQSNLQTVKDTGMVYDDAHFMNSITDARSLEYIKAHIIDSMRGNNYRQFSSYQRAIYDRVCKKCSYAKNEVKRPIGIRRDANGKTIIVNRCEEWDCQEIGKCRKDLTAAYIAEKLKELKQNQLIEVEKVAAYKSEIEASTCPKEPEQIQAYIEEQENPGTTADDMELENENQPEANLILPDEVPEPDKCNEINIYDEEATVEPDEDIQISDTAIDEVYVEEDAVSDELDDDLTEPEEAENGCTETVQVDFHEKLAECIQIEQSDYLYSDNRQWWLINSGPGTGKTELLAQRIAKLMCDGVDLENVLVLCYSRSARDVVKARSYKYAKENNLLEQYDKLDIRTIDSFCGYLTYLLKNNTSVLPNKKIKDSFQRNVDLAKRILEEQPALLSDMKYFITDEIQDLVGVRAELILTILKCLNKDSCGVTLLGDYCQAIYDYAVKDAGEISSDDFYRQLARYPYMQWGKLFRNYRMSADRVSGLSNLREALGQGDMKSTEEGISQIKEQIKCADIDFAGEIDAESFPEGTTGIITRYNRQSLQISAALDGCGIKHRLLLNNQVKYLPCWIADVLIRYKAKRIDRERFIQSLQKFTGSTSELFSQDCWKELCRIMDVSTDDSCEVKDLLKRLEKSCEQKGEFLKDLDDGFNITVSCAHRAKGREYDHVLLLEDFFETSTVIQEARVLYVALTRSKGNICSLDMKFKKSWNDDDANGRAVSWFPPNVARGRMIKKMKARLRDFQFLPNVDLVQDSFATADRQDNISKIEDVYSSTLQIVRDEASSDVKYLLVDEDRPHIVYAQLSDTFVDDFIKIYTKSAKNINPHFVFEDRDYPTRFTGLVAKRKVSLIGQLSSQREGIKDYDGVSIWYGLEPEGLLTPRWDDMY